ncbi:MAG: SecY family transport protein [Erysipelotrichaceae bacterium]
MVNLWNNKQFRYRCIVTIAFLCIFLIGGQMLVPGVLKITETTMLNDSSVLDFLTASPFSWFFLGIGPYIITSILIDFLGVHISPLLKSWKREGFSGQKKIRISKYCISVLVGFVTAMLNIYNYEQRGLYLFVNSPESIALQLTVGGLFVIIIAEIITKKGLGSGLSYIILISLIKSILSQVVQGYKSLQATHQIFGNSYLTIFIFIIGVVALTVIMMLFDKKRKQIKINDDNSDIQFQNDYISLKYNSAGTIPLLFTSMVLGVTNLICINFNVKFSNITSQILFILLFISITFISTWVTVSPVKRANMMKLRGLILEGIAPGDETIRYFKRSAIILSLQSLGFILIVTILFSIIKSRTIFAFLSVDILTFLVLGSVLNDILVDVKYYARSRKKEHLY